MAANRDFADIDVSRLKTYSIKDRPSKVGIADLAAPFEPGANFAEYITSLPKQLAAVDLLDAAAATAKAAASGKTVMFSFGAHFIKVGLSRLLIDLMDRGVVSAIALNGAGIVHDFELAFNGTTSEDVDAALGDGSFGAAEETGRFLNEAITEGAAKKLGLGAAIGSKIIEAQLPHRQYSLLAAAYERGISATVHVAVGTDIIHIHPSADGAAIGECSLRDFMKFTSAAATLEKGVYYNIGSAVLLPEIFLKAVTLARNLGYNLDNFTAVNMDFIRHYRPLTNVVGRPTSNAGRGINLVGSHELMFPLLVASIIEKLQT